ncbi:hypothetical protein GGE12_005574 [Rhizobium mongolense]|uniref:Uncharacterized protein n=1 Tax=Rhizobium mongolense TaxID=57676 RepID=A0A7W6RSD8_9HYPH|nr:hypothetical protein [Rhizobium mongolense]
MPLNKSILLGEFSSECTRAIGITAEDSALSDAIARIVEWLQNDELAMSGVYDQ